MQHNWMNSSMFQPDRKPEAPPVGRLQPVDLSMYSSSW